MSFICEVTGPDRAFRMAGWQVQTPGAGGAGGGEASVVALAVRGAPSLLRQCDSAGADSVSTQSTTCFFLSFLSETENFWKGSASQTRKLLG